MPEMEQLGERRETAVEDGGRNSERKRREMRAGKRKPRERETRERFR